MAYIDVISLAEAKNYLRIDDIGTEDDAAITRMINSSLRYVETYTNVLVYARDVDVFVLNGLKRLYDYPINTDLSTLTDYDIHKKGLYINICDSSGKDSNVTINMGYINPVDVPQELLEVAYEMIDLYYYGEKDGKPVAKKLSSMSMDSLNINKRFFL